MNYDQAVEYIHSTKKLGSKLGLSNITTLLNLLGNPQNHLKFIHVAGTNGKGSTCSYIANALMEDGNKIGMFISPYIEKFTERIQVNFQNIKDDELVGYVQRIKSCIIIMLRNGSCHPTEFEINTAIGMIYFYEQNVDYVVLETGLGGRYDSTNVILTNEASVITAIGIDHEKVLGNSLDKIAFEKAGIIKNGKPVFVYGDNEIIAKEVVKFIANEKKSKYYESDISKISNVAMDDEKTIFDYKEHKNMQISLKGEHQIKNATLAIDVLDFIGIKEDSIKKGLEKTKWPGRLEVLCKNPYIICDGAHNPHAALVLKKYLNDFHNDKEIIYIMGVMKRKEYDVMASIVLKNAKKVICIEPNVEGSLKKEELVLIAQKYCNNVVISDTIEEGIKLAIEMSSKNNIICSFGSLYYIKDVKKYVKENNLK